MGIRGSKMTILRLHFYRVSGWNFSIFGAFLVSRNIEERTAGNERERDRVREREIPEFPKPPAPALRFGSMNPISRVWANGSMGERRTWGNYAWYQGKE